MCVFVFGVTGVLPGYMTTVHDYINRFLNIFLMIAIQTAWIGYITDMVAVGQASQLPGATNAFIPLKYNPEDVDLKFVGAMGILGIMVYSFGFVGSIPFKVFFRCMPPKVAAELILVDVWSPTRVSWPLRGSFNSCWAPGVKVVSK